MTQKHHQEEISGPIDAIEAAPLAKDCPQPKRTRIQSQKARENQTQSQLSQVLSLRPIPPTVPTSNEQKLVPNQKYFSSTENDVSQSKQRRRLLYQNSSQRSDINTQHKKRRKNDKYKLNLFKTSQKN